LRAGDFGSLAFFVGDALAWTITIASAGTTAMPG
jgi:hypothetical protein